MIVHLMINSFNFKDLKKVLIGWEMEHGRCIANILRKYPSAAYLGKNLQ